MKMSDRVKKLLVTVGLGSWMWFILTIYIFFAFKKPTTEQNILGLINGAVFAYNIYLYYTIYKSIHNESIIKNLPAERLAELIEHAKSIATINKQEVELKDFPLSYFRMVPGGPDHVYISTGCSWRTQQPEVVFVLTHYIRIDNDAKIEITSRRTPIELAPEWLKKDATFQAKVKEEIEEKEKEMKENCKAGSIDKLKQSLT